MPKPYSEQIQDWTNTRAEKTAKMLAIMEKSGETGETLDEAQQEEYDNLKAEIARVDKQIENLRDAEKMAAASAKPVSGNTPDEGTVSRGAGGPIVTSMRRAAPPGINFARYAMCIAKARGNPDIALKISENQYPSEQDLHSVLKAAVVAGSTGDPTWGGNLVQYVDLVSDFITFLNPRTIIGAFGQNGVPGFTPAPFNSRIKRQTSGGEGYWIGEGQAKPLTRFDFDFVTLRWTKIANIAALTDEEMRFGSPSAEGLVREALVRAISKRLDLTFMDRSNGGVTDVRPAAITNGVTPIASTGTDEAAARADLGAVMSALGDAELNYGEAVWIMNSANAIQLFLMQNALGQMSFPGMTGAAGGTLFGRPVVVSNNMVGTGSPPTSDVVLVVPSEIYLADDGQVTVDASREASLEMDDAPTMASTSGSPATPTGAQLVSMFQTNSVALRAERYINWMRRRDAAVQVISGAGYSAAA